jgi:hypothetical protein
MGYRERAGSGARGMHARAFTTVRQPPRSVSSHPCARISCQHRHTAPCWHQHPCLPPVAVKKFISVRSQARGLANDWPIDEKLRLRCGVLREPSRLPCCSERCPAARRLADRKARSWSEFRRRGSYGRWSARSAASRGVTRPARSGSTRLDFVHLGCRSRALAGRVRCSLEDRAQAAAVPGDSLRPCCLSSRPPSFWLEGFAWRGS